MSTRPPATAPTSPSMWSERRPTRSASRNTMMSASVAAATPVRIASPLPAVDSWTTLAPCPAATADVASVEPLSTTTTSSTSRASSAAYTTAPTVSASFHAGMTATDRWNRWSAGDMGCTTVPTRSVARQQPSGQRHRAERDLTHRHEPGTFADAPSENRVAVIVGHWRAMYGPTHDQAHRGGFPSGRVDPTAGGAARASLVADIQWGDMHVRRTSSRRTLIGALAALAIVAGACSSDRDDDPTATGEGGDAGGTDTTAAPDDGGDGAFGDLESPCGEGEAAAGGATEQGVTADEVVIGYGDDAGFPTSPGLSHETSDAMRAMIDWCNEQGGINGRQIVGRYYDAAITDVVNAMTQACGEVFMLVGEAWALDSGQEETRLGCDLPAVPTYSAYPEFGWEFLDCPQEYNIAGEPDWKPFAQRLKDCGAEIVYYLGQPYPNMQNLLDDAAQIDYRPVWVVDVNAYLQSFADWNTTGNGDNVHMRTSFTPFEQAEASPATQQYMDIVQGSGGDISQLAEQTTSSFLLWATAAKECGAELTRQCVVDELSQITSWTGGGLHEETNPGENMPPQCFMILKLDGTSWVQAHPEEQGEFVCNPESNVELTGRVVDQAELDENRVSTKYLP